VSPLIDSPDEKVRWLILRAVEDARLLSCSLKIESALLSRGGTSGEHSHSQFNSTLLHVRVCDWTAFVHSLGHHQDRYKIWFNREYSNSFHF